MSNLLNNLHARELIRCTGFIYMGSLSVYHLTVKMDPIMQSAYFSEIDTLSTSDPWLALIGGIRPSFWSLSIVSLYYIYKLLHKWKSRNYQDTLSPILVFFLVVFSQSITKKWHLVRHQFITTTMDQFKQSKSLCWSENRWTFLK